VVSQSGCDRQILPDESHRRRDYVEIPHLSGLGTFRSGLQSGWPVPNPPTGRLGYFQIRPATTAKAGPRDVPTLSGGVFSERSLPSAVGRIWKHPTLPGGGFGKGLFITITLMDH
jgi:hypothetical protein